MNDAITPKSAVLLAAAKAAEALEAQGVAVLAHYSNGRQAVLIIDKAPTFVRGVVRRWHPNGRGGTEYILAAPYQGMQIEWSEHFDGSLEVINGTKH